MKLVKSLLLGSAAGLAVVSTAAAADLPSKKAAPVEYVRVCSAQGVGFFYIPGTETCLRISGRVRADYQYAESLTRTGNTTGFRARGIMNLDARTQTGYGTLRAFVRFQMDGERGTFFGAGDVGVGNTNSYLDKAFIQWAGITAGRAQSFFDFYAHALDYHAVTRMSDLTTANLLAYTATFGGGFSATLSIEDPTGRRTQAGAPLGAPAGAGSLLYSGSNMPDIVANLRVDQGWGSAQLMAALHEVRGGYNVGGLPVPGGVLGAFPDTEYGYAVGGGVKINLPFLAAGDQLWLEAGYSNGALSYTGGVPGTFGGLTLNVGDAYVDAFGNVETTEAFNIFAGLLHYWTPSLRSLFFGSYLDVDVAGAVATPLFTAGGGFFGGAVARDFNEIQLGASLIWTPAAAFDIGLEVLYTRIDVSGRVLDANLANGSTLGDEDIWQARLRFQRDF